MPPSDIAVSPPPGHNRVDVDRAWGLHSKLCELVGAGRQLSYLIAESLYEIKRCEYYIILGHNSFEEYASSPEIAIAKSRAYTLAAIYECYVVDLGKKPNDLDSVPDLDRIGMIVPLIKALRAENKPDAEERINDLIEDAKVLSRRDLCERKRELLGMASAPFAADDDPLAEFVGQVLVGQERRIEVDGAVKVVLTFKSEEGLRKVVFYATGKDVGISIERLRREVDRQDARRPARL